MKIPPWKHAAVSADGTHHVMDERPLYERRFLEVLSFHEPGLAAVRNARGAWHIDVRGRAAYARVFSRTFGFYQNFAAVQDLRKWFHITPDGAPAYDGAHDWCGNFQGGYAVVRRARKYFHILPDGNPLYKDRFIYAGDFRERRAVVRLNSELCAHMGEDGLFAHPFRYRMLDVYHKGFARAMDDDGWMHINIDGRPAYCERFAAVEPFYNGYALAETQNGDTVVVNETGRVVNTVAKKSESDASQELSADMTGYWKTHILSAAAEIGAMDRFPVRAGKEGVDLNMNSIAAQIFLAALNEMRIAHRCGAFWKLTTKGELMNSTHLFSLSRAARGWGRFSESEQQKWSRVFRGESTVNIFCEMEANREELKIMHGMLSDYARRDYETLPQALPLKKVRHLIDAGGGVGVTAELIAAAYRGIHITVMDRPEVLSLFNINRGREEQISKHAGDLFLPWNVSGDAVLLARVLHDWDDERALSILRHARAAVHRGGKLFIAETLKKNALSHGLCSAHLFVVGGGRERTLREYATLMKSAKFKFSREHVMENGVSIIIGESQ